MSWALNTGSHWPLTGKTYSITMGPFSVQLAHRSGLIN